MSEKNAASTARNHERLVAREGKKLSGIASAAKAVGRKRKGLNAQETRTIVTMLRGGQKWSDVERRFGPQVEAESLAKWRPVLEQRAATPDRPRLAKDDQPEE